MTNTTQMCGDTKPHKEHHYRRISEGRLLCPGHNNPEPPRSPVYDCEEGTADLCPLHAAAPDLLQALELAIEDEGYSSGMNAYTDSGHWVDRAREAINKARGDQQRLDEVADELGQVIEGL